MKITTRDADRRLAEIRAAAAVLDRPHFGTASGMPIPPPVATGAVTLPMPPMTVRADRAAAARWPQVFLLSGHVMPYGLDGHVEEVRRLEAQARADRKNAAEPAKDALRTAEAEAERLGKLAADARKAALAADEDDGYAIVLRVAWADIAEAARVARRQVVACRDHLELAKVFASSPPAWHLTVAGVLRRKAELHAELGIDEPTLLAALSAAGVIWLGSPAKSAGALK